MTNKSFIFLFLCMIMSACSHQAESEDQAEDAWDKHTGVIVHIEEKGTSAEESNSDEDSPFEGMEGWYFMLVIPDVDEENISDKTDNELKELAEEEDGAYYNVPPSIYEEKNLDIGRQVVIYFDRQAQGNSEPPVRDAEEIKASS